MAHRSAYRTNDVFGVGVERSRAGAARESRTARGRLQALGGAAGRRYRAPLALLPPATTPAVMPAAAAAVTSSQAAIG
jgi:hypothetical protein